MTQDVFENISLFFLWCDNQVNFYEIINKYNNTNEIIKANNRYDVIKIFNPKLQDLKIPWINQEDSLNTRFEFHFLKENIIQISIFKDFNLFNYNKEIYNDTLEKIEKINHQIMNPPPGFSLILQEECKVLWGVISYIEHIDNIQNIVILLNKITILNNNFMNIYNKLFNQLKEWSNLESAKKVFDINWVQLEITATFKQDFSLKVLKIIHQNVFMKSVVYLTYDKSSDVDYILKVRYINPAELIEISEVLYLLKNNPNPNLCNIVSYHIEKRFLFLLVKKIDGDVLSHSINNDIINLLSNKKLGTILGLILDIAEVLSHLHSIGLLYQDLKHEQIIINKNEKIILLDLDTIIKKDGLCAKFYLANSPHNRPRMDLTATEKSDIFSLGTIFFELLTGHHVYEKIYISFGGKIMEKPIENTNLDTILNRIPDNNVREILKKFIAFNPQYRYDKIEDAYNAITFLIKNIDITKNIDHEHYVINVSTNIFSETPTYNTQSTAPPSSAGLIRYYDEEETDIKIDPRWIIVTGVIAIIIIELLNYFFS
ncbi:MAG: preprotein translocase subunit Sec61beta [Candidatus Omnitrophica bacterium]|nr:preprotein translocase subunit Sec61beta [Candidatus Nanoarchaeia archaeon]MDD5551318.1 preprotein translocase subunit Sec61beta [Candidatus Omnitrophota bacterium]